MSTDPNVAVFATRSLGSMNLIHVYLDRRDSIIIRIRGPNPRTEFCTASGVEADEIDISVDKRNVHRNFAMPVGGIGGSPQNGSFSM